MGIVSGGDLLVETAAAVSHALLFFLCNILTIIVCKDCAANSVDVEFFFFLSSILLLIYNLKFLLSTCCCKFFPVFRLYLSSKYAGLSGTRKTSGSL